METKQGRWYSPRIMNNLLRTYNRANELDFQEGMRWYTNAHLVANGLAERWGFETKEVCGVIAALSPGRQWELNLKDTSTFLEEYKRGARGRRLPAVGSYGRLNLLKAERCLVEDPWKVLGGNKVRAFYACLIDPTNKDWVCIDRHAKSAALGMPVKDNQVSIGSVEYQRLAKHYKRGAERLRCLPNQFQAVCWVTWRRLNGVLNQEDLPF